jgi:GNAT superfamily N-acetyltransferase
MTIGISALDTQRWGVRTAKAAPITAESLPRAIAYCRQEEVKFLIARCASADLAAAHAMEHEGFELMDALVYYARDLAAPLPEHPVSAPIRSLRRGEEVQVREAASESFAGYFGHYHADPRLDRRQCDETYVDWAYRSCLALDSGNDVLVSELDGRVLAFATVRLNSREESEGVLFGVTPAAQGRGLYRALMLAGMQWSKLRGAGRMVVSTQFTNIAVQKVWTRLGFEPSKSYYTFHKWFEV